MLCLSFRRVCQYFGLDFRCNISDLPGDANPDTLQSLADSVTQLATSTATVTGARGSLPQLSPEAKGTAELIAEAALPVRVRSSVHESELQV